MRVPILVVCIPKWPLTSGIAFSLQKSGPRFARFWRILGEYVIRTFCRPPSDPSHLRLSRDVRIGFKSCFAFAKVRLPRDRHLLSEEPGPKLELRRICFARNRDQSQNNRLSRL